MPIGAEQVTEKVKVALWVLRQTGEHMPHLQGAGCSALADCCYIGIWIKVFLCVCVCMCTRARVYVCVCVFQRSQKSSFLSEIS